MSSQLLLGTLRCSSRTIRPRCAVIVNDNIDHGKRNNLVSSSTLGTTTKANEKRKEDTVAFPPSCNIHQLRSFSSSSSSSDEKGGGVGGLLKNVSSPLQWWRDRQESNQAEKYKQRVDFMVNKPNWTLNDMMKELDEVTTSWTSKIPGVNNNKEIVIAKQMHKTVSSIMSIVGVDATIDELDKMTRTQKLQAAVQSEQSLEEINIFIQQFSTASLMHRVLRKRKLDGKRIPETPDAMQEIIQTEGKIFLTKTQKEKLKKQAIKSMKKSMR